MMQISTKTIAIVLAGGVGSRLHPLTAERAKPSVPFGGIYRIIDFTLSNCLHSGLRKILILTQYKSHSLNKHLRDGWSTFNPEIGEYITAIPAQMRMGGKWYAGTADAIYQNIYLLERDEAEYVLILAGDHIYRMDYSEMLKEHIEKKRDVTVACMPVSVEEAKAFGVIETDTNLRIRGFVEKVSNPPTIPGDPDQSLASMGIYVFNRNMLLDILKKDHALEISDHDFGKNILPEIVGSHHVGAYFFGSPAGRVTRDQYWRDVGTLDAYYQANMDLLKPVPPINLYQRDWSIRTYHGQFPSARMVASSSGKIGYVENASLAGGDVIIGARVIRSILSHDVRVEAGALVEESILFDNVRVGPEARLRRCIIDKGVTIPPGETIGWDKEHDGKRFTVSEKGVTVVTKGYRFPDLRPTISPITSNE
ncbi:MAG: glucose-1-phosphate adenylyltransferase [Nitrospiria bacterium]